MPKTAEPSPYLHSELENDNLKRKYKNQIQKGKMSEKGNIKISKRRVATYRSDGRYQVYAVIDNKRKACYGKTEYEANCKADVLEADEEVREMLTNLNKRYLFGNTFYRYRNYLLFYTRLEHQTVDRYEVTYNKYFRNSAINNKDVRSITENDIVNLLNSILEVELKITTKEFQRIKHIIKAVIGFAYDEELEDWMEPVFDWSRIKRKIPHGKIYQSRKREYAVSNTNKTCIQNKVLNENVYPEKYAYVLMILINFSLGLRIGELAALQEKDVDTEKWIVRIHDSCKSYKSRDEYGNVVGGYVYTVGETKTPKGQRELPVSYTAQQLFKLLFQYRKEKGYRSKYLAYDGESIKARVREMSRILVRLCDRTNQDYFNSHIIRKTFATNLSKCPDIDIATISEYMGHAQVSTTLNNYLIPSKEEMDERIKQMSQYV